MTGGEIFNIFGQLVFPIAVAAFLLVERVRYYERLIRRLANIEIAILLILEKGDLRPEYKERVREQEEEEKRKASGGML